MKTLNFILKLALAPALVIMVSECQYLGMVWIQFLAAGYVLAFALITTQKGGDYVCR